MKIELPHFGNIELEYFENEYAKQEGYENYVHFGYDYSIGATYGNDFKFQNKPLDLDINFTDLSKRNILLVTNSLNSLDIIIQEGKKLLFDDFNSNGEVKNYINEWIEYYLKDKPFKDLVKQLFTDDRPNELLNKMKIVRIGFYELSKSHPYIVMDFAFGYEIDSGYRDDMVVIKLDRENKFIELTTKG